MGNVTKIDIEEMFEYIFFSVIVTILHFFKIHRKMIFGNSSVIVQNMLRKTPKSFNAVDMVLAAIRECFAVVQAVMFAPALQRVVATERISVVDRSFSGVLSDMTHQLIGSHSLHHLGIHPSIALQKPKYNAFSGRSSSALAFPPAAEVGLVNLDLAFQFTGLKFRYMIDRLSQTLIDAGNRLIVQAEVACYAIGGLLLVEPGKDGDLLAKLFQGLLFSTSLVATPHIATQGSVYLERAAKNALSTPQKVGRTVENVLLSSNHKGILALDGYESN